MSARERLVDTFTVVRLWEIPQERVLDTDAYALWPLASAMAGANIETTIDVAQRIIEAPVALDERRELTGLLFTLAGLRLPLGELLAQVRRHPMIDELLHESGLAEEFIREGMERGRDEGVRTAVRLALEGRVGVLDTDLAEAVAAADQATLEQVLLHVATETPEQLRARLGLA